MSDGCVLDLGADVAIVDVGVVVDRPAFDRRDDGEPVRLEEAAFDERAQVLPPVARQEVELRAALGAVLRLEIEHPARGPRRDDVDDAAHRVVAIQARGRAVGHLDTVHAVQGHTRPVDPAAEGIVEGDAVQHHERAALPARSDAAQGDALRGWLRHEAAGATEEAERRHLPQHVIGDERGRGFDFLGGDDIHARGDIAQALLGAGGRYSDRFEESRRFEHEVQVARLRRRHLRCFFGEPTGEDDDRELTGFGHVDGEPAVGPGGDAMFGASGAHDNGGPGNDAAGGVVDDP